ncbi:hypothetical protein E3N88_30278 [Mikania micrantha]|uniref:Transposase-associated domain-containing protein n=1 Tax=Mikania micrantha TaxID=192012 RepID=A0A5N6ML59_9ASTR|nr:hypothetical protein E3N88_30278 [Mikania micrantha]
MDKSWMGTNRIKKPYIDGVAAFIDYAVHNLLKTSNIDPRGNKQHLTMPCPCTNCLNHIDHTVEEVHLHLFSNGIDLNYTNWIKHGENYEPSISAPTPVNATPTSVNNVDFASEIPTDGPDIVEMNYRDAYDEVDEEFSTVIHPHNDNILPRVDRRDLGNESRNDYYRTDCGGIVIRKSK